ncbi:uncharacterized protein LOC108416929 [Pygocentrus nattereri]|uniref:uncharacterized protein LOC108416929 n=1 Tax=Pygocentrus nattereri TaxID=42514 RepID=UPI001890D48A|nr:uncharacterized protein LOC108416929 [Pygocentrus nattereri]
MDGKKALEGSAHHSTVETRSVARASSSKSSPSKLSASSRAIAAAHAKVEAARARAEFAKKESDVLIEKARIEARLNTLRHEKEVIAALAEASVLEAAEESEVVDDKSFLQEVEERTRQYVQLQLTEDVKPHAQPISPIIHVLKTESPPRQRLTEFTVEAHSSKTPELARPAPQPTKTIPHHTSPWRSTAGAGQFSPLKDVSQQPVDGSPDISDVARYLARRDLITSGLSQFDDSPETYWAWKSSFINAIVGLHLSASNPSTGLTKAWERLEECFGSPEIIEKSLFDRLINFPKVTNKDPVKLRELSDLLHELEAAKLEGYLPGLSYLDTARGVAPIVEKLPYNLQERWLRQGFKYKATHGVTFPPFSFFCEFVCDEARARNDPGFRLQPGNTEYLKQSATAKKPQKSLVFAHKTDISQEKVKWEVSGHKAGDVEKQCPLHKKPHPLKRCRGFRSKPLEERKALLKDIGVCFRCCSSTSHMAKECTAVIKCRECDSENHVSALHPGPPPATSGHGGESTEETPPLTVESSCTEVCGEGQSPRSCSKICLVKVFPEAHPERVTRAYAVLDDQSNRSLARPDFFDMYNIKGSDSPFTLRTCAGTTEMMGRRATGFIVQSLDGTTTLTLPTLIECSNIPSDRAEIPTPEAALYHTHLKPIAHSIPSLDPEAKILLLLGRDLLRVHKVREQRNGPHDTPYAQRVDLGWVIVGDVCLGSTHRPAAIQTYHTNILENKRPSFFSPCPNKLHVKEKFGSLSEQTAVPALRRSFKCTLGSTVFETTKDDSKIGLSVEDRLFLELMGKEMFMDNANSWVAPLPFRTPHERLPHSRDQALTRLASVQRTLEKRPEMKKHFVTFMQNILDRDHAEQAPPLPAGKECWYLPIFGVYHPQKPDQIRVVFDSSAKSHGVSLNDVLLSGPDLNNSLVGVLLRFRREAVAVTVDIEQMFHSFVVREDHRDFLRFFWHKHNDPADDLCEYRMKVHVFGNSPSPSVAIYGLRRAAAHGEEEFGSDARCFTEREFYVDDGLLSRPTASEAIDLLKRTQKMLAISNIRLHKVASNSREVMEAFPVDDRAKGLKELNLDADATPIQRSLGLRWNLTEDTFTFQVTDTVKPYTRRGVLATINGLFDPLGFAAPVTIQGKMLLRELSRKALDWDSPLPADREAEWSAWRDSLSDLQQLQIRRPYAATSVSTATRKELHVFADASVKAIAAVAYLKVIDAEEKPHVGFVLGKAKLAPQSAHTIPRLELGAAVLAVEIAEVITSELDIDLNAVEFYTDSRVVLGYISNQTRRFYVYVGNRVQRIRRSSEPKQWHYVSTNSNPADIGTRSVSAAMLSDSAWLKGPAFLSHANRDPDTDAYELIDADWDAEVRATATHLLINWPQLGCQRFERFSSWKRLIRAMSLLVHIVQSVKNKAQDQTCRSWHYCKQPRSVEELAKAVKIIIKSVQKEAFKEKLTCIAGGKDIPTHSPLHKLSPYCDEEGMLRIGGRLRHGDLEYKEKHPLVLPGGHVAKLLVEHHHQRVMHQGRVFTEGAVRSAGYWIIGARRLIKHVLHNCITCRKLRGRANTQLMADLPPDRLSMEPPFTFVGLDVFGPWPVVTRRTRGGHANSKRWAILFTCLSTRAIHIELIESMDSSSFINAFRRFISLRGPAKQIRSDCGTNFVGACRELGFLQTDPNLSNIRRYLGEEGCTWVFNPPHSSHMGGSWERMIGISRRILDAMFLQSSHVQLTHEVLSTLMAEITAIINARPLSPITTDPDSPFLLTPAMLLTQKVYSPPPFPGGFDGKDLHRQQWRQVQHLADIFWNRWRREYLGTLQSRRKWQADRPNLQVGDLVLLKDQQVNRNEWPIGLIHNTFPDKDGKVRKVEIKIFKNGAAKTYQRPVSETVLLMSRDTLESQDCV